MSRKTVVEGNQYELLFILREQLEIYAKSFFDAESYATLDRALKEINGNIAQQIVFCEVRQDIIINSVAGMLRQALEGQRKDSEKSLSSKISKIATEVVTQQDILLNYSETTNLARKSMNDYEENAKLEELVYERVEAATKLAKEELVDVRLLKTLERMAREEEIPSLAAHYQERSAKHEGRASEYQGFVSNFQETASEYQARALECKVVEFGHLLELENKLKIGLSRLKKYVHEKDLLPAIEQDNSRPSSATEIRDAAAVQETELVKKL